MNYTKLGNSGLYVTEVSFGSALTIGTENDSEGFAKELISTAWSCGIRSFDTANSYGAGKAEYLLGKALDKYPRQDFVLATKCSRPVGEGPYYKGLSRKHILWAIRESLDKLGVSYVDIYYAHRPDPDTPMRETIRTFQHLMDTGLIRYWGTSEWSTEQLQECHSVCKEMGCEPPMVEQFIYSYAIRKVEANGVKEFCDSNGIGTLCYSPLAQGLLTGKYKDGIPENSRIAKSAMLAYDKTLKIYEQNRDTIDFFINLCHKYEINGNSAALQWCVRNKIYPVIGASKAAQIVENIEGFHAEIPSGFWEELASRADL